MLYACSGLSEPLEAIFFMFRTLFLSELSSLELISWRPIFYYFKQLTGSGVPFALDDVLADVGLLDAEGLQLLGSLLLGRQEGSGVAQGVHEIWIIRQIGNGMASPPMCDFVYIFTDLP